MKGDDWPEKMLRIGRANETDTGQVWREVRSRRKT